MNTGLNLWDFYSVFSLLKMFMKGDSAFKGTEAVRMAAQSEGSAFDGCVLGQDLGHILDNFVKAGRLAGDSSGYSLAEG